MSEEQPKASAETEATAQVEEGVEEISEEDLAGVDGGGLEVLPTTMGMGTTTYRATMG